MPSNSQQLVTIQRAQVPGAKSMFCFPGAGDSITAFLSLAECLGASYTIYGIQARGLDGTSAPHSSVEQAVLDTIDSIRAAGGTGPYLLLGHSFGGWIAFETARRLAAAGATLGPVILLDTDPPEVGNGAVKQNSRLDVLMELVRNLEDKATQPLFLRRAELAVADRVQQAVMLMDAMKKVGLFSRSASVQSISRMLDVFEANLNTRYSPPTPLGGDILLIYPSSPQPMAADETGHRFVTAESHGNALAFSAWASWATRATRVEVPGTHMSMLASRGVLAVADNIRKVWDS